MAAHATFAIGVDFGTNSVRAAVVDTATGEEIAVAARDYPHGDRGVITDARQPNLARQHPADYDEGFARAVGEAVSLANASPAFAPDRVVGLGVGTTGSTPIPVDQAGRPLALDPRFANDPDAMAWLWKDHTSHAEAAEITERAAAEGLPYLTKCGGVYSSEWFWSKILRCARTNTRVAEAAYSWVELCDYVPGALTGTLRPETTSRGVCAAGHKAMHHPSWDGLPSAEFLDGLWPGLSRVRARYAPRVFPSDHRAGRLTAGFAERVGLPPGVPVAVGALDAHMGAVGAGVAPGTLVKILGTSTCDCMVTPLGQDMPDIPGVCGMVPGSILPGMVGIEAGQSAVGDIFDWFVSRIAPGGGDPAALHATLSRQAAQLEPGQSGLLALDWHNGNRCVLVDPLLTGLVVGHTLQTTPPEIYRALIEATAFGALTIINRLGEFGVAIDRVVNCGGIAEKSPLVMQIYADVCDRPMHLSRSSQTCALGAAVFASVVGGVHPDVPSAQRAMTGVGETVYHPDPQRAAVYRRLYAIYRDLHDAFGAAGSQGSLGGVMKQLISIRDDARRR